jgi:outer membrane protein TolC
VKQLAVVGLGAALVLSAPAARAQEAPIPLTLEQAIAQGLANSHRLAELQGRHDAAAATEDARKAAQLPIVAAQGGYTRTNHVEEFAIVQPGQLRNVIYPDVPDNFRARLDLQWPIYTAGRLDALERAARAERSATGADLDAARADLRLEITRAFWALVTAAETERVLERSLAAIDSHVRDLRNRLEQGLIPPNEVLTAEARQANERLLSIEATNARGVAEADLRRLIGVDSGGSIQPQAVLDAASQPAPGAAGLIDEARAARMERKALENRVEAAEARIDAAVASARPQLAVAGGFDYARPNPRIFPREDVWHDSWDISLNVNWSLWDGGRNRAERAEAAATASSARARAADFDRQLAFEVTQRRLDLDSSRAAIAVANTGLRAAVEAQRVVNDRYDAGVATNTEVLDSQTDVLQAELALTRALANVRLAEARLARALGR